MSPPRDPFSNFDRMRRQIDELFGDVWSRAGISPNRRAFSPRVDVYYYGDPPKAVIKADLAGVDPNEVNLEVRGRVLVISGERKARDTEGRVYQQIEIGHAPRRPRHRRRAGSRVRTGHGRSRSAGRRGPRYHGAGARR